MPLLYYKSGYHVIALLVYHVTTLYNSIPAADFSVTKNRIARGQSGIYRPLDDVKSATDFTGGDTIPALQWRVELAKLKFEVLRLHINFKSGRGNV